MRNNKRFLKVVSFLIAFVMLLSACPLSIFAAETIQQGEWKITNDASSGTATYGDIGFTYYSPTTVLEYANSGGKDYVKSNNTNGSANNDGIVATKGKSYCDFTAKADGTLTVFVGNNNKKTGYVSKTVNGTSTAIGSFVPGGTDNYDKAGFEVVQGKTWTTVNIECEKGATYYITVSGSKMLCYGAEYVNYTNVSGTITDSFNLGDYQVKFTNKEKGIVKDATVTGNTYTALLKPGSYVASLVGKQGYGFTADTRRVEVAAQESQTANLTVEQSKIYTVSGAIKGIEGTVSDLKLTFDPEDTASFEPVEAAIADGKYSAELVVGAVYNLTVSGAYDYETEALTVSQDSEAAKTQDITFTKKAVYAVTGNFIGLTQVRGQYENLNVAPTAVTFKNVADGYTYNGTVENGKYSVSLREGAYQAAITGLEGYSTTTHVVVKDSAVTRDLLLKAPAKAVEYKAVLEVGSDKEYKSVQAAVDAVANMTRTADQAVTIKIAPGTYREQVVVNSPNVTLVGSGEDNTKITWYYGIGYKYYSCVNSYYDPYADYDKFEKGDVVSYWGSAVIVNKAATGFKAENITLENSFNKYMTEEEMADGVEVNGRESIKVARKENTVVDSKTATERGAALVNYADKTEFKSCSFIGSQDTLYTCNVGLNAYYKDCYIEGQTDFIYGNGNVIFDSCEINFCGYSDVAAGGYLTANSNSIKYPCDYGYIFRNCYVSYNSSRKVTPGYLGRMWGDSAKVAFINTQLQKPDMIVETGWNNMTVAPTAATVTLVEYNTTYNGAKVDTSKRVAGVKDTLDESLYTVDAVFIKNGWTPSYYVAADTTKPTFAEKPAITSNGDINIPNPGETVTVSYKLNTNDTDTSLISYYAVAAGYDETSLDTLLESATLLKSGSAVSTNKFQIPMECAGKYLMVVVTPITLNGGQGDAAYVLNKSNQPVSSNWSDPDNEGSIAPGSGINIYLAGDSTVKDYSAKGIYNSGKILSAGSWGEYLQDFFKSDYVTVNNYAQGGRSSRSFINEGKLDTIIGQIKAGDYLLIQFGHNDCANGASYYQERYCPLITANDKADANGIYPTVVPTENLKVATPDSLKSAYGDKYYSWDCGATYKGYIQYYIDKALEKGAIPVIVSPVARLYYTGEGKIRPHHDASMTDYAPTVPYNTTGDAYVTACEQLYEANKAKGVLYIDAFNITKALYEEGYAKGGATYGQDLMDNGDSTHSNKTGGVIQAGLLAKWFKDNNTSVSEYVKAPASVYGEEESGEYIFTIDKTGKFTAKNKALKENTYWTKYGQELFNGLGGIITEPEKEISLNFATEENATLLTNAESYTDGAYTGVYTNEEGQEFAASIYEAGINYLVQNNAPVARFGTKATKGKAIFSLKLDKAANYTFKSTGVNEGTVAIFSDSACTKAIASAKAGESFVYKKASDEAETVYFTVLEGTNHYVTGVTVSYVIPKVVTFDLGEQATMEKYENAANFVDGVYAGDYTNAEGVVFSAEVYQAGVQYYDHRASFGSKFSPKVPFAAVTLEGEGMYTFALTAGTGSGTVNLYSDKECTTSIVENSVPGNIVYKKKTADAEKVYIAASAAPNLYVNSITIKKEELPPETKMVFTGKVNGVEADDTNVTLALKSATETVNVTVADYEAKGVELICNTSYDVIAKGDKGVYTCSFTTDESGAMDIALSRLDFSFPLDFIEYFEDYSLYLDTMGYGSSAITDPYSGITVAPSGIVLTANLKKYGAKTNSNEIMSFKAEKTGACTVTVNVSAADAADTLILKVNDTYAPCLAKASGTVNMTVMVNKGDKVTIYTPSRKNLWYKSINVTYGDVAFMPKAVAGETEALLYGELTGDIAKVEKVGFYLTTGLVKGFEGETPAVESTTVYDKITYNDTDYSVADGYVFGNVVEDLDTASTLYAYAFATANGSTYYSPAVKIK